MAIFRIPSALLAVYLCSFSSVSQAAPRDVELVNAIVERGVSDKALSDAELAQMKKVLIAEVLGQVDVIAIARDYPGWFSSDNEKVIEAVYQLVSQALEGGNPKKQLMVATLDTVSGVYAEQAMAMASGFPMPARSGGSKAKSLSASVTVRGGGVLAADLEQSAILNERGTIGAGNGVLDPGEWATLSLSFENRGKNRLVSTSVYAESTSECLWIERPGDELASDSGLREMMPGERSTVTFHVFRSLGCDPGKHPSLRVRAHDTHEFANPPIVFDYDFKGKGDSYRVGYGQLASIQLDGDDYGHSEPTSTRPLLPDTRVELVAGYLIPGQVPGTVEQRYQFPSFLKIDHTPGRVALRPQGGKSIARFADDVDITVPTSKILNPALAKLAREEGWATSADARILVAVDTVVRIGDTPGEASEGRASYSTRHYFHLPILWNPELLCTLGVSPKWVTVPQVVTISGVVSGQPQSAVITLIDPSGAMIVPVLDHGEFTEGFIPRSAGDYETRLEVLTEEGDLLCEKTAFFEARPPVAEARPAPVPKAKKESWPRKFSIEPGSLTVGADLGAQLGFSVGDRVRFVARGQQVQGDIGFGVGLRVTTAVPFEGNATVFEPSVQLLGGIDGYFGGFVELDAVLALHGTFGPFLSLGVLATSTEAVVTAGGGLGFHFPREVR